MQHRFGHSTFILEEAVCSMVKFSCWIELYEMINCTGDSNCTGQDVDRSVCEDIGFLISFMGGLSLSLNVPTNVALRTARAIAKGLRMYLISALVSGILIIQYKWHFHRSDCLCDSILWCPSSTSSSLLLHYLGDQYRSVSKVLQCCGFFPLWSCLSCNMGRKTSRYCTSFFLCALLGSYHYFFPSNIKYLRCVQWASLQVQSVSQLKMTPSFLMHASFSQCYWWLAHFCL